jgi:hypothetical protein
VGAVTPIPESQITDLGSAIMAIGMFVIGLAMLLLMRSKKVD